MDMGTGHGLGSWVVDHGMWAMLRGLCYWGPWYGGMVLGAYDMGASYGWHDMGDMI